MCFQYGETEIAYLKSRDKRLAAAISQIGHIERKADDDLFSSVVHHIIGQQISTAAQATIWNRLSERVGAINEGTILNLGRDGLQSIGITYEKNRLYFRFFKKRYSPYGTVASLYLWAIAGGAIPTLTDPASGRKKS